MSSLDKNMEQIVNTYAKLRPVYINLANKVESIIREVLKTSGASYYIITSRAKEVDSFSNKANKEKYKNPLQDIKDLAGIRIITYVKSEVEQCCNIIKPLFVIDPEHSVDKTKELGNDKVGYRSIHYVAKLTNERLILPEYSIFNEMYFEIQIRTILEHAWADISHDRNYKFHGVLPPDNEIPRRFALAAATLELVDREFDSLAKEISMYDNIVKSKVDKDDLNIGINTRSLSSYLHKKFKAHIEKGWIKETFNKGSRKIVNELKSFGVNTLKDLDQIIGNHPDRFISSDDNNFLGLLRHIMMMENIDLYFRKAWRKSWRGIDNDTVSHFRKNGIDINRIIEKYKLDIDYGYYVSDFDEDYDDDNYLEIDEEVV